MTDQALERVRRSFAQQSFMRTLGVELTNVKPGAIDMAVEHSEALTQQHGFLHAGVLTSVVDSACGYAAFSMMPPDRSVLSIEFKVSLMRPASARRFEIEGRVVKPGRTIFFCRGSAFALENGQRKEVLQMQATVMAVERIGSE